jgi:hypothetical protein
MPCIADRMIDTAVLAASQDVPRPLQRPLQTPVLPHELMACVVLYVLKIPEQQNADDYRIMVVRLAIPTAHMEAAALIMGKCLPSCVFV